MTANLSSIHDYKEAGYRLALYQEKDLTLEELAKKSTHSDLFINCFDSNEYKHLEVVEEVYEKLYDAVKYKNRDFDDVFSEIMNG